MPSVLIVGSGVAGLAAAVSAAENGADVLVLERAPQRERGGGSRYTEAYLRLASEDKLAPRFHEDFAALSGNRCDMALVDALASGSIPTLHWVRDLGARFDTSLPTLFLSISSPRLLPVGGGAAILDVLEARARDLGVNFVYERVAYDLIVRDEKVTGIQVLDPTGRGESYDAAAVVLACGGYQGNPDMERKYFRWPVEGLHLISPGSRYNQGEGIEMALNHGASPAGDYENFHAETKDPRSEQPDAALMCFPFGVVLNVLGDRFIDEAATLPDSWYEEVARAIWRQPDSIAYTIVDDSFFQLPGWQRTMHTEKPPIVAESLDEMVEKLPFKSRQRALQTLRAYNEAARSGGVRNPNLDGVSAVVESVPKSNWAYRLENPPFRAYPIACANVLTFGGLATSPEAQVLDVEGKPMPGLFAVGETMGLYYERYVGATSVMRGMVFGRIAGRVAARHE